MGPVGREEDRLTRLKSTVGRDTEGPLEGLGPTDPIVGGTVVYTSFPSDGNRRSSSVKYDLLGRVGPGGTRRVFSIGLRVTPFSPPLYSDIDH